MGAQPLPEESKFTVLEGGLSQNPPIPFVRKPVGGMGEALVKRTVYRASDKADWGNVATRVALGNTSLHPSGMRDFVGMCNSIAAGRKLMSGRHLQHGDALQYTRNMEVFTNCSVTASSFSLFYLLLNGSGVGRDYSEQMLLVDYDLAPQLLNACCEDHPDFDSRVFMIASPESLATAEAGGATIFRVPDSREGWAKAFEIYERMAFEGTHADRILVLDWSDVRPKGALIGGMQDRPASGPVPTALAFRRVDQNVRGKGYARWKQTMMVDHYLAECVLVGGARRSARMATMNWQDPAAADFALFKQAHKDEFGFPIFYSSNNSIICTDAFYQDAEVEGTWAHTVFNAATRTAYHDGTGEPGFINVDRFAPEDIDFDAFTDGEYMDAFKYAVDGETKGYLGALARAAKTMPYNRITNPCGEICLNILCGYCVIADVVPFHAETLEQAEEDFRLATRALMRVNLMDSLFKKEVTRTNRIGVGFTGLFEFAIKFFGISFKGMLDEHGAGKDFWLTMARFSRAVKAEATTYAAEIGVARPATDTTVKPAGSTSKIYGLSEGAHLPAMREYLRWMQFRTDDPLVAHYAELGYPVRELTSYAGTSIVGFPTQPTICKLNRPELVVTAAEATPDEQYAYLRLLEKYWITGVAEDGDTPLPDTGNQVSYTLKYDPKIVDFEAFKAMMKQNQSTVKCCSVMPQVDTTAYEYQPEEPIGKGRFLYIVEGLKDQNAVEQFDLTALQCASGSCPI